MPVGVAAPVTAGGSPMTTAAMRFGAARSLASGGVGWLEPGALGVAGGAHPANKARSATQATAGRVWVMVTAKCTGPNVYPLSNSKKFHVVVDDTVGWLLTPR